MQVSLIQWNHIQDLGVRCSVNVGSLKLSKGDVTIDGMLEKIDFRKWVHHPKFLKKDNIVHLIKPENKERVTCNKTYWAWRQKEETKHLKGWGKTHQ